MTSKSSALKEALIKNGVKFDENSKVVIPSYINKIKFDIGISCEAIHTENWLNQDPDDLLVFGFEALPICVEKTRAYYSQPVSVWPYIKPKHFTNSIINTKWLDNQFIIVPFALGNLDKDTVDFYVTNSDVGCSSILKPSKVLEGIGRSVNRVISIPIYKLSDFFELLPLDKIDHIDYIKVDVQGTDLAVIKSGGQYISDKVVFVTMEAETDQYENASENSLTHMVDYMKSIGFLYIKHTNTNDATFLNSKFQHLGNSIYISQFN
jgi:FkbM family methyltransferase